MIDREDMLELTRRMTVKRTHISRIAGCYVDADGDFDGSFNIHFLRLNSSDRAKNLLLAKSVPFAGTNSQLKEHSFPGNNKYSKELLRLLNELKKCRLENDALLELFYRLVVDVYKLNCPYAVRVFYGAYDIPVKGSDKKRYGDSEEVYEYIICTISPLIDEYEPGDPDCGFLFPAYSDRSADLSHIDVFSKNGEAIYKILGI